MRNSLLRFIELNQIIHFINLTTEISFIVFCIKNHLIHFLHLRKRKFLRQKFEYQRLMYQVVTKFYKRFIKYIFMIEHQVGNFIHIFPFGNFNQFRIIYRVYI